MDSENDDIIMRDGISVEQAAKLLPHDDASLLRELIDDDLPLPPEDRECIRSFVHTAVYHIFCDLTFSFFDQVGRIPDTYGSDTVCVLSYSHSQDPIFVYNKDAKTIKFNYAEVASETVEAWYVHNEVGETKLRRQLCTKPGVSIVTYAVVDALFELLHPMDGRITVELL